MMCWYFIFFIRNRMCMWANCLLSSYTCLCWFCKWTDWFTVQDASRTYFPLICGYMKLQHMWMYHVCMVCTVTVRTEMVYISLSLSHTHTHRVLKQLCEYIKKRVYNSNTECVCAYACAPVCTCVCIHIWGYIIIHVCICVHMFVNVTSARFILMPSTDLCKRFGLLRDGAIYIYMFNFSGVGTGPNNFIYIFYINCCTYSKSVLILHFSIISCNKQVLERRYTNTTTKIYVNTPNHLSPWKTDNNCCPN